MNKTKIIVPALILCAIASIGIIKNRDNIFGRNEMAATVQTQEPLQTPDNSHETMATSAPANTGNAFDFSLSSGDFNIEELSEIGMPVIIDYGSETCGPCRDMADDLERVNAEVQGRAVVKYVDIYENPELAYDVPVRVTPTQLLIDKNGNPYVPPENSQGSFTMYSRRDTDEHVYTVHEGALYYEDLIGLLRDMGMSES